MVVAAASSSPPATPVRKPAATARTPRKTSAANRVASGVVSPRTRNNTGRSNVKTTATLHSTQSLGARGRQSDKTCTPTKRVQPTQPPGRRPTPPVSVGRPSSAREQRQRHDHSASRSNDGVRAGGEAAGESLAQHRTTSPWGRKQWFATPRTKGRTVVRSADPDGSPLLQYQVLVQPIRTEAEALQATATPEPWCPSGRTSAQPADNGAYGANKQRPQSAPTRKKALSTHNELRTDSTLVTDEIDRRWTDPTCVRMSHPHPFSKARGRHGRCPPALGLSKDDPNIQMMRDALRRNVLVPALEAADPQHTGHLSIERFHECLDTLNIRLTSAQVRRLRAACGAPHPNEPMDYAVLCDRLGGVRKVKRHRLHRFTPAENLPPPHCFPSAPIAKQVALPPCQHLSPWVAAVRRRLGPRRHWITSQITGPWQQRRSGSARKSVLRRWGRWTVTSRCGGLSRVTGAGWRWRLSRGRL